MNSVPAHPRDALFAGEKPLPAIAVCEPFAGSEKLIYKSFALQYAIGPLFDLSCDCEDGASRGQEVEHAKMVARMLVNTANRLGMAGARFTFQRTPHGVAI